MDEITLSEVFDFLNMNMGQLSDSELEELEELVFKEKRNRKKELFKKIIALENKIEVLSKKVGR